MFFHLAAFLFFLYQLIRFLKIFERSCPPTVHSTGSKFARKVLKKCPALTETYCPPSLWGKCGHIQTLIYGKLGRFGTPHPTGERHYSRLPSGETISFDIFQPLTEVLEDEYTILVCPGIANSSEKAYIRTFVQHAMERGYRVSVLNHIGSLSSVKLTSPKIFTYGDTKYFAEMIDYVQKLYAGSKFLIVGYSMGGNIALKYLGEDANRQKNIMCAISLCQGYDAVRSTEPMKYGFGRIYNRMITANLKRVIRPHWNDLFTNGKERSKFNAERVRSATCLYELEDAFLRRIDGHSSVHEYMDKSSCSYVLNHVRIPVLLVNTEDDPVVTNEIHDIPKEYAESHPEAIFATYKYGGHLGYYTGPWYSPDRVTLLEKIIVQYLDAIVETGKEKEHNE